MPAHPVFPAPEGLRRCCGAVIAALMLAGCSPDPATGDAAVPVDEQNVVVTSAQLASVLAAQPEEVRARYAARHPQQTLEFFGIVPGMTVVEADPGTGWYTGILRAWLGAEGTLIGADYPLEVYRLFNYYSDEELAAKETWAERWPREVAADGAGGAALKAYAIGSMPASLDGSVDAFLLIRALHNLADFEEEGRFLSDGLAEVYRALKPGGVVGIVQHSGPETHSDAWASGANGYLKKRFVIAAMESAGFIFEAESAINENPKDRPTEEESVWRLAPTSEVEDPDRAAAYAAIGESNRMTLRFRKPGV